MQVQHATATTSFDTGPQQRRCIVVFGQWEQLCGRRLIGETLIIVCDPDPRACRRTISQYSPEWIIIGTGLQEEQRQAVVQASRLLSPGVLVAMIGPEGDLMTFERWMRRGCSAYLAENTTLSRVLGILSFVQESKVVVVDQSFQEASHRQQVLPVADLTRRESEVLFQLRSGRRNREIAAELNVSASTVDFHVRNVLAKLGARNRVEAVKRAQTLGL